MGGTLGGLQVTAMLKALALMAPATITACPDGCLFLFSNLVMWAFRALGWEIGSKNNLTVYCSKIVAGYLIASKEKA